MLKPRLRGKRFADAKELNQATVNFIRKLHVPHSWFQSAFDKWIKRHGKCVKHKCEYFEKEW